MVLPLLFSVQRSSRGENEAATAPGRYFRVERQKGYLGLPPVRRTLPEGP
jgi:hypothetical protein